MGRRGGGSKRGPNTASVSNNNITLREELTGKKGGKGGGTVNAKSALKLEHLQRLAVWTGGEASVPCLGAFFGNALASAQEALGVAPDPSLLLCQRCETILQPGFNCTVRIEKNRAKARRRKSKKQSCNLAQNNVVYTCHLCSHRNLKRGTPNGHMKVICPPQAKATTSKLEPVKSISKKFVSTKKSFPGEYDSRQANEIAASSGIERGISTVVESPAGEDEVGKVNEIASSEIAREIPTIYVPSGGDEVSKANETASSEIAREIRTVMEHSAGEDEVGKVNEIASSEIVKEIATVNSPADEDELSKVNETSHIAREIPTADSPATPMQTRPTLWLGGKMRKRNKSASKKPAEPENSPTPTNAESTASKSNKRRRKTWTSLKEIAESSKHNNIRNSSDLTTPFFV